MVPQNYVRLEGADARQMLKLMEALEDHDDVQKVSANFDISEADMAAAYNGSYRTYLSLSLLGYRFFCLTGSPITIRTLCVFSSSTNVIASPICATPSTSTFTTPRLTPSGFSTLIL